MWTVVQFALLRERDYRAAFELLEEWGFRPHRSPRPQDARPYPAAVIAALSQDSSLVTRAVFERLAEEGLAPIAVMASRADVARAANAPRALAQG